MLPPSSAVAIPLSLAIVLLFDLTSQQHAYTEARSHAYHSPPAYIHPATSYMSGTLLDGDCLFETSKARGRAVREVTRDEDERVGENFFRYDTDKRSHRAPSSPRRPYLRHLAPPLAENPATHLPHWPTPPKSGHIIKVRSRPAL